MTGEIYPQSGDQLSQAQLAKFRAMQGFVDYVVHGISLTSDYTNNVVDISAGYAVIQDGAKVWDVRPDAANDLAFTDADVNYVYLVADVAADTVSYTINTTGTEPTDPALLVGTIDDPNTTTTENNRASPAGAPSDADYVTTSSHGDLSSESIHANLSGTDLHSPASHNHSGDTLKPAVSDPTELHAQQVEETTDSGNTGTSFTIDVTLGTVWDLTLTGDCSFSFSGAGDKAGTNSFTLILTQDSTGGRSPSWPTSVVWAGGSAPTISSSAGATDVLTFFTPDEGSTWYGMVGGQAFA